MNSTAAVHNLTGLVRAYLWMQVIFAGLVLVVAAGLLRVAALPYTGFALTGTFLIFLSLGPGKRDIGITLALGAVFGAVYFLYGGAVSFYFGAALGTPGGFLGVGAIQLLVARWIWAPPSGKPEALRKVGQTCVVPVLLVGSMIALAVAAQLTPQTFDPLIYAFDTRFGAPPSWVVAALFYQQPWLFTSCVLVYNSLPLALSGCLALQWRARTNPFDVDTGLAFVALGVVGFLLYQVAPVCGPVYLFPKDFPAHVPALLGTVQSTLPQSFPRNGMPSLHVAWALLLLWNLRRHWVLAIASAGYAVLTILATVGSGQHYLADLILAPALVLLVQAGCGGMRAGWQRPALVGTSVLILGWLIAFRTGAALAIPAGAATWAAAGISFLAPVVALCWASPGVAKSGDAVR